MAAVDSEDEVGPRFSSRLIGRLLSFARPHRRGFATSIALLLVLAGLTLSIPWIIGEAVNRFLQLRDGALVSEVRREGLWDVAFLLAGIGAAVFVIRYVQLLVINRTGQRVIHDLRMAVYRHVLTRSLRFFDRQPVGKLVTRVTSDIETLNEFFVSGVDVFIYDVLRIGIITGLLFAIDWKMALATLAVVPLIAIWSFIFQRRARRLFRVVRSKVSGLNAFLNESLTGVRVVQLFRREQRVTRRFEEADRELRDAHVGTVRNFSWFFPGMELASALGTAFILIVGHQRVLSGSLEIGDMMACWLYQRLFIEPLRQLADKYNILQAAVAAGERVFGVLDDDTTLPAAAEPAALAASGSDLVFDDVHFSYDGKKEVLKGISWTARAGERIALVGPTGSGKSTIINLLSRFYDPDQGSIRLDGRDLRELDVHQLRRRIGVVLQDVFLFAGTVRENLTLGDEDLDDARLLAAAEAVQADRIIARLGGLDAEILERGATLSTGEKQLLAFARTLAHDPMILVLDEATAHIDTATELQVQRALERLMLGRTSIVIAHRLSTIQKCDRILVIHHGEIRERGTHSELLTQAGLYARLHRMQFI